MSAEHDSVSSLALRLMVAKLCARMVYLIQRIMNVHSCNVHVDVDTVYAEIFMGF